MSKISIIQLIPQVRAEEVSFHLLEKLMKISEEALLALCLQTERSALNILSNGKIVDNSAQVSQTK